MCTTLRCAVVVASVFLVLACLAAAVGLWLWRGGASSDPLELKVLHFVHAGVTYGYIATARHSYVQREIGGMLEALHRICERHGLGYWAAGGTLIGAARHQDWVPWDGDVDVCMLHEDYLVFLQQVRELPSHCFSQNAISDAYYSQPNIQKIRHKWIRYENDPALWHHGVMVDIFLFSDIAGDGILHHVDVHGKAVKVKGKEMAGMEKGTGDMFPLGALRFGKLNIKVARNYCDYLVEVFGACPPVIPASLSSRFMHEGQYRYDVPDIWRTQMYPLLYAS